jgi:hypothetical protein
MTTKASSTATKIKGERLSPPGASTGAAASTASNTELRQFNSKISPLDGQLFV